MNSNFKQYATKTTKSIYKISQETGIPYTTLNELMNDKININNVAAETVYKLSLYFDCSMNDLLNPFTLLEHSRNKYNGISYCWVTTENGIELQIVDNEETIVLTTLKTMLPNAYIHYMSDIPELLIDDYLSDKKEMEALL